MCVYSALNGTYLGANGARYTDPKQGDSVGDCYLISALSSIAWVNYDNIPNKAAPYSYNFWDWSSGNRVAKQVNAVDNTVSTAPIGARSVESAETWPAIYEKAYAIFRNIAQEPGCGNTAHRNLSAFATYNPVTTLAEISGLAPTSSLTSGDADGTAIFNKINAICSSKKTKYPAAAITKAGAGAGLQGSHSYSVLGVHDPYIILRNPNLIKPAGGGIFLGLWNSVSNQKFSGGAPVGGPTPPVNYDLSTIPGVFGLDKNLFKANFEKYGWVLW